MHQRAPVTMKKKPTVGRGLPCHHTVSSGRRRRRGRVRTELTGRPTRRRRQWTLALDRGCGGQRDQPYVATLLVVPPPPSSLTCRPLVFGPVRTPIIFTAAGATSGVARVAILGDGGASYPAETDRFTADRAAFMPSRHHSGRKRRLHGGEVSKIDKTLPPSPGTPLLTGWTRQSGTAKRLGVAASDDSGEDSHRERYTTNGLPGRRAAGLGVFTVTATAVGSAGNRAAWAER